MKNTIVCSDLLRKYLINVFVCEKDDVVSSLSNEPWRYTGVIKNYLCINVIILPIHDKTPIIEDERYRQVSYTYSASNSYDCYIYFKHFYHIIHYIIVKTTTHIFVDSGVALIPNSYCHIQIEK